MKRLPFSAITFSEGYLFAGCVGFPNRAEAEAYRLGYLDGSDDGLVLIMPGDEVLRDEFLAMGPRRLAQWQLAEAAMADAEPVPPSGPRRSTD